MEVKEIKEALQCFSGTTVYHIHQMPIVGLSFQLTDGCDFVRQTCGAYWLFDAILSYQFERDIREMPFQKWVLAQQEDDSWLLSLYDGNDHHIVTQLIPYSDFPIETITIYVIGGVVLLPSEY